MIEADSRNRGVVIGFHEARRWHHFEKTPGKNGMGYIHALLDAIRVRVLAREIV